MKKENVIGILECMLGCVTPTRVTDNNGANECFCKMPVEDFIDEDLQYCLLNDNWKLVGVRPINPMDIDMDEWAQEFDARCVQDLKKSLQDGYLSIASFQHEVYGEMDIIIWK